MLGINLPDSSQELRQAFESADVIIAKGHANFESLIDVERDVFFLLKAKCPVVARRLTEESRNRGVKHSGRSLESLNPRVPESSACSVGDSVFLHSEGSPEEEEGRWK
jgi:hypothetical protein